MYIAFENELGKIDLNGGVWRIKSIDGLGLPEKTVNVITYPDTDGQELISAVTMSRSITLSGDVLRRGENKNETERAMRILNKPGTLKLRNGAKQRKIGCRCGAFLAGTDERNAVYQSFVLQLVCDYPYFEDLTDKKLALFKREDLIQASFTLPCVFTERISRVNAVNSGDAASRPRVYIVCQSKADDEGGGIELVNHTLNQRFKLGYKMAEGEEIIVDFGERTVKSSLETEENNGGNLIAYLSDDTFLSEFYFEPGVNDVECIIYGEGARTWAVCEYSNKYVEAVI